MRTNQAEILQLCRFVDYNCAIPDRPSHPPPPAVTRDLPRSAPVVLINKGLCLAGLKMVIFSILTRQTGSPLPYNNRYRYSIQQRTGGPTGSTTDNTEMWEMFWFNQPHQLRLSLITQYSTEREEEISGCNLMKAERSLQFKTICRILS